MDNKTLFALDVADIGKLLNVTRLPVGTHVIDETVMLKVSGTVTVGQDYEQRIVAEANPWKLLQVALSKLNGVTVDMLVEEAEKGELDTNATKTEIEVAFGKVLTRKEKKEYAAAVERAEHAGEAIDKIKEGTWKPCKGKVTKKINIQVLPVPELETA